MFFRVRVSAPLLVVVHQVGFDRAKPMYSIEDVTG